MGNANVMSNIRVLLVHNEYQNSGAEDTVFQAEKAMLQKNGHAAFEYRVSNLLKGTADKLSTPFLSIWAAASYVEIKDIIRSEEIDLVHFHNTFFRISPSAYYACKSLGIPVVQTLHNYRLICPAATLYRSGRICETCLGKKIPINAIQHKCYRSSFGESLGIASMLSFHNLIHTWQKKVNIYISLSDFSRQKFIEAGLPASKIVVKPNFLINTWDVDHVAQKGDILFLGRLTPEKGLFTLLKAWTQLTDIPLKIAGDGPLRKFVEERTNALPHVEYLGLLTKDEVMQQLAGARFLVFPSEWYEGFPLTLLEAFSLGVPVLASALGAAAEIVQGDSTMGVLFKAGDAADLARQAKWMWTHPAELAQMSENVRREYEEKYTPEKNYAQLLSIYERVLLKK